MQCVRRSRGRLADVVGRVTQSTRETVFGPSAEATAKHKLIYIYKMAISMKGLRLKPKYADLIGVAVSDQLYNIKFPNRDATFLRNGVVLSQLDGEGMRQMQIQQEQASKKHLKKFY